MGITAFLNDIARSECEKLIDLNAFHGYSFPLMNYTVKIFKASSVFISLFYNSQFW